MAQKRPKSGLYNVILVWVIGLALGILAGTLTAMLLMAVKPEADEQKPEKTSANISAKGKTAPSTLGLIPVHLDNS